MMQLKRRGFVPDVIVGHPGWGEMMLAPEVFPDRPIVAHAEFYYSASGADVGFDPEFPDVTDELRLRLKAKNLPILTALADCHLAIAPTDWQASRFPADFSAKLRTIHEGIRTDIVKPDAGARFLAGEGGPAFTAGDEVMTFVNRNLEPMRGFHTFMRALPRILAQRPAAHVVIVGGDGVSYGAPPPKGKTWKGLLLEEVGGQLPLERVHFVGQIPYARFLTLLQVSRLHVYATYPFVLSWSMLEAMSAGALVLGSATRPVTEMIEHGRNGLLFDFFDIDGLVGQAVEALARPRTYDALRQAARQSTVERFDLAKVCLPRWLEAVEGAAGA
jgi:glycosyltransferase involved in cell wall biosynthesis